MDILTRSTSDFSAIDIAENHGGKSTGAIENIKRQVRSSINQKFHNIYLKMRGFFVKINL